jgi:hypothetical protein
MKRQLLAALVGGILLVSVLAFQNCGMTNSGFVASTAAKAVGTGSHAATPGTTSPGSTNPATVAPTAAPAGVACMKPVDSAPTLTGLTNLPTLQTTYTTLTRLNTSGIRRTSLTVSALNSCITKTGMLAGGKCPTPSPTPASCAATPLYFVSVTLVCDPSSDTTTTCTNFAGKVGQSINLSDATLGASISIAVTENPNICNPTGTITLLPAFTSPMGSIKITKLDNLNTGTVISIDMAGIVLNKIGVATPTYTLGGTISGEIITPVACTP